MIEISCIMPTRGRRAFVPLAVRCWLEQTLPAFARELIVIDDGPDPCGDLLPRSERVRYVHLQGQNSIGAKLNLGCEMARGNLLAAWADDDYHAAWRLEHQVEAMQDAAVDVCGCDSIFYWSPGWPETLWRYDNVPGKRANAYVTGGTMMWRRAFWAQRVYDEGPSGEDTRFIQGRGRLLGTLDNRCYLATIHGGNTSTKHRDTLLRSEQWQQMAGHVLDLAPAWGVAGVLAAAVDASADLSMTGTR